MVFGGFLGFYSGFELLTTKTSVKTKQKHEFLTLRDSFFFEVFCWFLQWLLCFFMVFGGFSRALQWFRALDHQNRCKH